VIPALYGLIKGWRLPLVRRQHGDFITHMIIELAANGYGKKSAREAPGLHQLKTRGSARNVGERASILVPRERRAVGLRNRALSRPGSRSGR
jgi:hypothetical protein